MTETWRYICVIQDDLAKIKEELNKMRKLLHDIQCQQEQNKALFAQIQAVVASESE